MDFRSLKHFQPWLSIVASAMLVLGLAVGWWLGTWSTCGTSCGFNVDLFEAWGTWVGGVAIAFASLSFSISQVMSGRHQRQANSTRVARLCVLRAKPAIKADRLSVNFSFKNKSETPVQDVSAHLVGGRTFRRDFQVEPGSTWGFSASADQLGLPTKVASIEEARQLVNKQVRSELVFVFSVDGHRFVRRDGQMCQFDAAPAWRTARDG